MKTGFYIVLTILFSTLISAQSISHFDPSMDWQQTHEFRNNLKGEQHFPQWEMSSNLTNGSSVVDSILTFSKFNRSNNKLIYSYDSDGKMISELRKEKVEGQWVNNQCITYSYDTKLRLTSELIESCYLNDWRIRDRYSYTYDTNGNKTSEIWSSYFLGQWSDYFRITNTYDSNGNMIIMLEEFMIEDRWVKIWGNIYFYDRDGNMYSKLTEGVVGDINLGSRMEILYRSLYSYDMKGNVTSILWEEWNGTQWVNPDRVSYTYNAAGNLVSVINEDLMKWTYTYDTNNGLIIELIEKWNDDHWTNSSRKLYTNDFEGNCTNGQKEKWWQDEWIVVSGGILYFTDSFGREFSLWCDRFEAYYSPITNVDEENDQLPNKYYISANYPNPFNPSTNIKYTIPQNSFVNITIYNLLGETITELVNRDVSSGTYEATWNAKNLPSGVYLISIRAESLEGNKSFSDVQKAVLLK